MDQKLKHTPPSNDLGLPLGWFDSIDIATYQKLVKTIPQKGTLVEVGVWQGRSLCSIANLILKKKLAVYAVDTFKGSVSVPDIVHDCNGRLREFFDKNITNCGIAKQTTICETKSVDAVYLINRKVNMVFIDADHEESQIRADIQAWLPAIKSGGVLAGHDYKWVKKVVHQELESLNYRVSTDNKNIWWIQKIESASV